MQKNIDYLNLCICCVLGEHTSDEEEDLGEEEVEGFMFGKLK